MDNALVVRFGGVDEGVDDSSEFMGRGGNAFGFALSADTNGASSVINGTMITIKCIDGESKIPTTMKSAMSWDWVDRYYDFVGSDGDRGGAGLEGWEENVMNNSSKPADYRNIEELLLAHYGSVDSKLPGMATVSEATDYYEQLRREARARCGHRDGLTYDEVMNRTR